MSDDERVTLRLPSRELRLLDVFVDTGMFPNRSEAIRQAIKDLIQNRSAEVDRAFEARQKLLETAARLENLQASLDQRAEQKLDKVEKEALRRLEKR